MSKARGYVGILRAVFDLNHPLRRGQVCDDPWAAYLDLWSVAAFKSHPRLGERRSKVANVVVTVRPCRVLVAHSWAAARWNVTEQRARAILKLLEKLELLHRESRTRLGTLYRVVGYEHANVVDTQFNTQSGGSAHGEATGKAHGSHGQPTGIEPCSNPVDPDNPEEPWGTSDEAPPSSPTDWDWLDVVGDIWEDLQGIVPRAVFERDLGPAGNHYPTGHIIQATRAYLTDNDDQPQFVTPKALAGQLVKWIDMARSYGWLPKGEDLATADDGNRGLSGAEHDAALVQFLEPDDDPDNDEGDIVITAGGDVGDVGVVDGAEVVPAEEELRGEPTPLWRQTMEALSSAALARDGIR